MTSSFFIGALIIIVHCIIGALAISLGIDRFKDGKYFSFGLYMMVVIESAAGIFDMFLGR